MKVAVVSAARTRSTLLTEHLYTVYPALNRRFEYYTQNLKKENTSLDSLVQDLLLDDNHIVKILGHNLRKDCTPSIFRLDQYDEIHLIERHDFFEQCCSLQVCVSSGVWALRAKESDYLIRKYDDIRKQKFSISLETVISLSKDIAKYLSIKQYLLDNNIAFIEHNYDNVTEYSNELWTKDHNLNYKTIISNYDLKEKITKIFLEHYSYDNLIYDANSFKIAIESIKRLT